MNAEQKQQAKQLIADWTNVSKTSTPAVWFLNGDCMAGFLQELVDAHEQKPVAYATGYYAGCLSIATVDGSVLPAGTALYAAPPHQSEHHLEMVNTPAPIVPDDFYNAVANLSVELEELVAETSGVYGLHLNGDPSPWEEILEGGRFERISSLHVVQNLLATRQPKQPEQPAQPAELVRDAERYRWLRNWTRRAYGIDSNPAFILPHVPIPTGPDQNIMRGSLAQHLDNAIDAAIERDKKGDQS